MIGLIALSALSAAAAVVVFAAALALYALLYPHVGAVGAAAGVALVFALLLVVFAFILIAMIGGAPPTAAATQSQALTDRLLNMATKRPIVATVAAAAAGLVAWRNPSLAAVLYKTFNARPGPGKSR
jgi:uncharacterized BrkB/YihY/UPF0761 family membrane protein